MTIRHGLKMVCTFVAAILSPWTADVSDASTRANLSKKQTGSLILTSIRTCFDETHRLFFALRFDLRHDPATGWRYGMVRNHRGSPQAIPAHPIQSSPSSFRWSTSTIRGRRIISMRFMVTQLFLKLWSITLFLRSRNIL